MTPSSPIPAVSPLRKWLLIGGVGLSLVVFFVALRNEKTRELLEGFNQWVSRLGLLGAVLYVLVYIAFTVLLIPGSFLTLGGGYAFGFWYSLLLVTIGANIGAALAFLIGRYFFREKLLRRFGTVPKFAAIDEAVKRGGWKIVLLLRLSPLIPFTLSNYALGLTKIPFWPYCLTSFFGMLPGSLFYVYIGYAGREALGEQSSAWVWIWRMAGLVVTAFLTWLLARIAKKALARSLEVGP